MVLKVRQPLRGWHVRLAALVALQVLGFLGTARGAAPRGVPDKPAAAPPYADYLRASRSFRRYRMSLRVYRGLLRLNPRQAYLFVHGAKLDAERSYKAGVAEIVAMRKISGRLPRKIAANLLTSYACFVCRFFRPDPRTLKDRNLYREASRFLHEAIRLDPTNVGARIALSYVDNENNFHARFTHAPKKIIRATAAAWAADVRAALRLAPQNDNALFQLGFQLEASRAPARVVCRAYEKAADHLISFSLRQAAYDVSCYSLSWQIARSYLERHKGLPGVRRALMELPKAKEPPGFVFHQFKAVARHRAAPIKPRRPG